MSLVGYFGNLILYFRALMIFKWHLVSHVRGHFSAVNESPYHSLFGFLSARWSLERAVYFRDWPIASTIRRVPFRCGDNGGLQMCPSATRLRRAAPTGPVAYVALALE